MAEVILLLLLGLLVTLSVLLYIVLPVLPTLDASKHGIPAPLTQHINFPHSNSRNRVPWSNTRKLLQVVFVILMAIATGIVGWVPVWLLDRRYSLSGWVAQAQRSKEGLVVESIAAILFMFMYGMFLMGIIIAIINGLLLLRQQVLARRHFSFWQWVAIIQTPAFRSYLKSAILTTLGAIVLTVFLNQPPEKPFVPTPAQEKELDKFLQDMCPQIKAFCKDREPPEH